MRIGIGVTTYNRPECLKECLEHIDKHTFDYTMYVAHDTDEDRKGVAYRKNECLRALKDCDYVFLFDDDCFPIKDGWIENFTRLPYPHLLYLNQSHNPFIQRGSYATIYKDCGGCFMFMTKECIDKVGAFNEKFETYGFEHAEYSIRINKAFNSGYNYLSLNNTSEYIYSHDYSTPNHKSSITDEEKQKCIKNNWEKFFNSEIKNIYLPL
jgi:GT2 family glycosyltransferase